MADSPATLVNMLGRRIIVFCAAVIVIGHLLEEARGYRWTPRMFPDHWEYIYHIADTSVAIAFAILTCLVIWFSRSHLAPFFIVPILGLLNWGENELKSRAFFGGFLKTIDWWQWAAIDASIAALVAILLKPFVQRMAPREALAMRLSIADLFLATLACAILLMATRSIATLPVSSDHPDLLFCGWPQTLQHSGMAMLMSFVAASALYLAIAANWKFALVPYVIACLAYAAASHTATTNSTAFALTSFQFTPWQPSLSDPLLIVFVPFAAVMLTIRHRSKRKLAAATFEVSSTKS